MYEFLRNEIILKLSHLPDKELIHLIDALDQVMVKYDIHQKESSLIVIEDQFPDEAKIYLVCKKVAGLADSTLAGYKKLLELFFLDVRKPIDKITTNDIRMWLFTYQKRRNISFRTLDSYRQDLGRFFAWAHDEGYISHDPACRIEKIHYVKEHREYLTPIELEHVRSCCTNIRDLAIVEVLYSTGCRVGELVILKKSDINWRDKSVHLFGKGRKHRTSFLNPRAEVTLRKYLETRTDTDEHVFVSRRNPAKPLTVDGVEAAIRKISDEAYAFTGKNVTPHIFRHTTATIALQRGMPIQDISKLLGHVSIETTRIYAKTNIEDVKEQHRRRIV